MALSREALHYIEWLAVHPPARQSKKTTRKCLPTTATPTLEELCINTIRILSADAVQNANSGHPGMPMGAAAMAYTLWTKFLKYNPKDPLWFDRDRFVLSAGHGSMLLYSLLHLTGYDLPLDELKRFRQWGSKTPGHPERGHTAGRRSRHRAARPGLQQRVWHGHRGSVARRALTTDRATLSSITTLMASAAMAT